MSNELIARFYYHSDIYYRIAHALEGFSATPDWGEFSSLRTRGYDQYMFGAVTEQEAAIILYRKDAPQEVLVIPFRGTESLESSANWEPGDFKTEVRSQVSLLLSIVRGEGAQTWQPQLGYENLLKRIAGQHVQALGWFDHKEFSAVRLPYPVDEYIGISAHPRPFSSGTDDILPLQASWRRQFREISESLQPIRDILLDSIDEGGSANENAQRQFSVRAYEAAKALAQEIHNSGFAPLLPSWLDKYKNVYLFDLIKVHRKHLNSLREVSTKLREQFVAHGEPLVVGATIDAIKTNGVWEVVSNGMRYHIRFENRTYRVYAVVLDEETLTMLETAVIIGQFVPEYEKYDFDYSVAACGLWKAVERELNLSLIWHLRRVYGIAGSGDKFRFIQPKSEVQKVKVCGQRIDKLDKEDETRLEGLMLGPIKSILDKDTTNSGLAIAFQSGDNTWQALGILKSPQTVKKFEEVHRIRNRFAHISSMRLNKYNELKELILPESGFSLLEEVLKAKQLIDKYWQTKDAV